MRRARHRWQGAYGTPTYSAPEQLRGEPPTVKSDLYAWGLVFLECLTGDVVMSGSNLASIFHKQLSPNNIPLPTAIAGHPLALLLRKVLYKKVEDRIGDASLIFNELKQINLASLVGTINTSQNDTPNEALIDTEITLYDSKLSEYKQITALAVVLAVKKNNNSNSDNEPFDKEVVDALYEDQKSLIIDTASRFGAYHVGTLADTLLFYFGYPQASDNDTRLSARCALEINTEIRKRNTLLSEQHDIEIQYKMAIHTGMVMQYADRIPEGYTPSTTMELLRNSQFGEILCSDSSRDLLQSFLQFTEKGTFNLGFAEEEKICYSLTGERQAEAFGFLRANYRHDYFVGRKDELDELITICEKGSTIRCAHVQGEAGIGKSRLTFELRSKLQNYIHLVAQCLPEYVNNALYPIITLVKHQYSLHGLSDEKAVLRLQKKLEVIVKKQGVEFNLSTSLPILCSWFGLPIPQGMEASTEAPDVQKKILFNTLAQLLLLRSEESSVQSRLLLFEDMHWSDPTTLEFVNFFVNHTIFREGNNYFISTSRKELPNPLSSNEFTIVSVERLTHRYIAEFTQNLFNTKNLHDDVVNLIIDRTDGIPLFIEELITTIQKRNILQEINGVLSFDSNREIDKNIPATLRELLQQKLDNLTRGKDTAQLASAIGREFDYSLLVAASDKMESEIQMDLASLIDQELVYEQRSVEGSKYIFKHALVRDAAYEGIPSGSSAQIHRQVAISLENIKLEGEKPLSIIARHYHLAHDNEKATDFGLKGIQQQISHSANSEALATAEETLQWCQKIDDPSISREFEVKILGAQIAPVLSTDGYGGDRVNHITTRIPELIKELESISPEKSKNLRNTIKQKSDWVLFLKLFYESKREEAGQLGRQMIEEAIEANDIQRRMVIDVMLAEVYFFDGNIDGAIELHEEAIALWDSDRDKNCYLEYGMHPHVQNLSMGATYYLHHGDINRSFERIKLAEDHITESLDDISTVFVYMFNAINAMHLNDSDLIKSSMYAYDKRYGQGSSIVQHVIYLRAIYAFAIDDFELAIKETNKIIGSEQDIAAAQWCTFLARLYMKHKQFDTAIDRLRQSLKIAYKNNTLIWQPYIKITLAKALYAKSREESVDLFNCEIQKLLIDAYELSNKQNSRLSELESLACINLMLPDIMTDEYKHRLDELSSFIDEKGGRNILYKPDYLF